MDDRFETGEDPAGRKTNAELVAESEALVREAQELVKKRKKTLAARRRRAAAENRRHESHAKLRIGAEVLRWTGNDWSEFDAEAFTRWLADNVDPGMWRTGKLSVDDAWGRLRGWEGGDHFGDYSPDGPVEEHAPAGIERDRFECPTCGSAVPYRTGRCPECGGELEWSGGDIATAAAEDAAWRDRSERDAAPVPDGYRHGGGYGSPVA